ncbi:hypothetical protein [Oceanitalea stevensii]|uniref:TetR family transcriptional regulator n=1 Tax=Oceanitalea stevensii TaxID=2763072 RepID=A0ABR8Z5Z0_9MICO|nr:hypothetical protein [Oceanitalea stevensii]MBD8063418.1 hypothetical protein [Oceanitalea stevensii]
MTAAPVLHEPRLASHEHAEQLLSALYRDDVARHLLGEQPAPTPRQVASTLRALADFPLCLRILPQSARRQRSGDPVSGLASYLEGFADHLAHHELRTPYDPRYWILGEPVTVRLLRLVSTGVSLDGDRPTPQQSAATLLALADTQARELPRRMVEVAGDGDLPWNGATGIGQYFRELADLVS